MESKEQWAIGLLVGAGVAFEGTVDEAQEHANKLAAFIQVEFNKNGIGFIRKQQSIIRRREGAQVDLNEQLDEEQSTDGVGLFAE